MTLYDIFFNLIFSFLGSLGFALTFNIKGKNVIYASMGGMIAWCSYVFMEPLIADDIVRYFLATLILSLYVQVMSKRQKAPTLVFLVIAFIPLVPGHSIYKTMEFLLVGNIDDFVVTGIHTFKIVMAIATGFLISSNLVPRRQLNSPK